MTLSFPYTLKKSTRARRLGIKISPERGIELVVPQGISEQQALEFLSQHQDWIQKRAHVWQYSHELMNPPSSIALIALNEIWQIVYETQVISKRSQLIERPGHTVVYVGNNEDVSKIAKLIGWVEKKAAHFLSERLKQWSHIMGLSFSSVMFRHQRTVWGTCKSDKTISLNYRLIFFPVELVDYVLIHELAHTQHMNHGVKFWRLVATFCADYETKRQAMRHEKNNIPRWFL